MDIFQCVRETRRLEQLYTLGKCRSLLCARVQVSAGVPTTFLLARLHVESKRLQAGHVWPPRALYVPSLSLSFVPCAALALTDVNMTA